MGDQYHELRANRDSIVQVVRAEEDRFDAVLTNGLPRLEEALDRAAEGNRVLGGEDAFRLYDSLGVPLDFMEDLAGQRGLAIDREGYERAMDAQRQRARTSGSFKSSTAGNWHVDKEVSDTTERFEGYESTCVSGVPIIGLLKSVDGDALSTRVLEEGESGFVALPKTPFYLESGGQVSDIGTIEGPAGSARVTGVMRVPGMPQVPRMHRVTVTRGQLKYRDIVTAAVDDPTRDATRRNHTATHLLHAALRQVLGSHVKQAGSLVAPDRLRFDFVHHAAVTREQLDRVERIVNEQVYRNTSVDTKERPLQDAMAAGAMALFGEKYGDKVRVVSVPGFSLELCGGTHVRATGDIGPFVITQESGVAAGVRRIEAMTGAGAVGWYQQQRDGLDRVLGALNTTPDQAVEIVHRLQAETKRLSRDLEQARMKAALGGAAGSSSAQDDVHEVKGVKVLARRVSGLEKGALRGLSDTLRDRLGSGIVVIASENDGKVALVVSVTKDLTSRVQAGRIVKEIAPIVGGGGGGRPDFAEAGGKDPSKIDELIARTPDLIGGLI
jgi:alanyl-tRNA synthetase